MACLSCHKKDDKHEGTSGQRCEQCHNDKTWRVERFDHARTRFPLAGGHVVATCAACHTNLRYRDTPSDCLSCHRKEDKDKHKATLGPKCGDCHNVRAWSLWDFDHDRATKYRLDGRHRQVSCLACHALPAPAGKAIAPVGSDCMSCHRKADVHEGRFGRRCEQCHSTQGWRHLRPSGALR
jgi:hypothetical protein